MRNNKYLLTIGLTLAMTLAGCASQTQKQDTDIDLVDVRGQADEAYEKGDIETSEKLYSTLVKEVPGEAKPWFRLANVYARTQRPDAAIRAYREALVRDPQMTKAWYNMGLMQLREAVHSFSELELYADRRDPLYGQGKTLLKGVLELIGEGGNGD